MIMIWHLHEFENLNLPPFRYYAEDGKEHKMIDVCVE